MAIEKPAPWAGASGTEYAFYVFGLEPDVPKRSGLYIYAKRNAEGAWVPIYMGHGDLSRCCEDPARHRCIAGKAATHLHLRLKSDVADRERELEDLLAHYANAFAPEGCHPVTTMEPPTPRKAERQAPVAAKPAEKTATKRTATKRTATKKTAAKKTAAGKTVAGKTAAAKTEAKKAPATRKLPVKTTPKSPRPRSK